MIRRFIVRLFVAIDQLGNVLGGGNPDITISARVGYFANYGVIKHRWYWKTLEAIINTTFWPLDGKNHCLQAFYNDAGEEFDPGGYAILYFLLNLIIVVSCIPLFLLFYTLYALRIVRPKNVDKVANLKKRLKSSKRKLDGVKLEFEKTDIKGDQQSLKLIAEIIKSANEIQNIIRPQLAAEPINTKG